MRKCCDGEVVEEEGEAKNGENISPLTLLPARRPTATLMLVPILMATVFKAERCAFRL